MNKGLKIFLAVTGGCILFGIVMHYINVIDYEIHYGRFSKENRR